MVRKVATAAKDRIFVIKAGVIAGLRCVCRRERTHSPSPGFLTRTARGTPATGYRPWTTLLFFRRAARPLALERDNFCAFAGASAQGLLETGRTPVFSQQIGEGFRREFLKGFHGVGREQAELMPGFLVKLHAFANHRHCLRLGLPRS